MTIQNQRPGVYSRVEISPVRSAATSVKYAAVAARANGGERAKRYAFNSYGAACEVFGLDTQGVFMRSILRVLFESGVSRVLATPVAGSYEEALALFESADNIGAVVTDAANENDLLALKAHVLACSEKRRERLGFCGVAEPDKAMALAERLNCERVVLCVPGADYAAALAGRLLAARDPAVNLNSAVFTRLSPPEAMPEQAIQQMLTAGVTVFESVGGLAECIRPLTTRTRRNGAADRSLTGMNTILIIDDVIETTRQTLKNRLGGGRVSGSPAESIRAQAAVVLAEKKAEGLLESFEPPRCTSAPQDPAVCVVEMSFRVAHVVSQILVTAHIEV